MTVVQSLMRACVFHKYGPKDNPTSVLHSEDIAKPVPKKDEVLVKVKAASVHKGDCHIVTGKPFLIRLMFGGIFRPAIKTPGTDVAGIVESKGKDVTKFEVGDAVFGDLTPTMFKGFAEYAVAKENAIARKPSRLSFEEAATIPTSGCTALLALQETGKLDKGKKILINGASGGVGSFAVQLAKQHGCEVTGTCSSEKIDFVKSIGADHIIDYSQKDFTKNGKEYDAIIDTAMNRKLCDHVDSLTPDGHFALVGGDNIIGAMFTAMRITDKRGKQFTTITNMEPDAAKMEDLGELMATGQLTPTIYERFPLDNAADAMKTLTDRKVQGKVIITMESTKGK